MLRSVVARLFTAFTVGLPLAGAALATDGVLEINQTCAEQTGCFAGDLAGFPVSITLPGSYRLTGPLTVADPNVSAIVVSASDVTIDLNGFSLMGPLTCSLVEGVPTCEPSGTSRGIIGSERVTVRNGIITGFGFQAVFLGSHARVEDVTAYANGGPGIQTIGQSIIEGCIVHLHENAGMVPQDGALVVSNTVSLSGPAGIAGSDGVSIIGNSVRGSSLNGIQVLDSVDDDGGAVIENAVFESSGTGIFADDGSLVRGNSVRNNGGTGLSLSSGGYLHNNFDANGFTVSAPAGSQIDPNVCNGNTTCP